MSIYLIVLDGRNPASPAAEKKRRQRLKMSLEEKDAQKEKERLSKNAKRLKETKEDSAQKKNITETEEQYVKRKKTSRDLMRRHRQSETEEQCANRQKTSRDLMRRYRQSETGEQCAKRQKTNTNRDSMRRKRNFEREEKRQQPQSDSRDCNGEDMSNVIDRATIEAKQFLQRTQDPTNPHMHRAIVCVICDRFIIGTETIHKLTKKEIGAHSGRLGVKSYEEFYQTTLKDEVTRQYRVPGLQHMLLSPRSRKYPDGYATCSVCYNAMQPQMASKKNPPKYAIAYHFVREGVARDEWRTTYINTD